MLFEAIADSLVAHRFHVDPDGLVAKNIKRMCVGYVDRISTLSKEPCLVCKTHDTYEATPGGKVKYIFVYGDPLDSAMSVEQVVKREGRDWFLQHQFHLRASGSYDDLYDEDVLNYRGQIESWLTQTRNQNVFCVDYEDLWDVRESLSGFLGFNVELPVRRSRLAKPEKKVNEELFDDLRNLKEQMKKSYGSSIERANCA